MGIRYLADTWEMLDLNLPIQEQLEVEDSADRGVWTTDDRQTMGQHHCSP
jgi:hypothetical protein